jgi:hypothetical protein
VDCCSIKSSSDAAEIHITDATCAFDAVSDIRIIVPSIKLNLSPDSRVGNRMCRALRSKFAMAGGMRSSLALGIGVVLGLSLLGLERMKAAETRTTVEGLDQRVHAAQITASQKVDGAKRNVEVSWEGQPESAMLVVNLDYYFGGQRVANGSDHWRTLHGPVLFRRISSSGTAKLEVAETEIEILHRENFWGRLGVYIVPGVSAMVMEPRWGRSR